MKSRCFLLLLAAPALAQTSAPNAATAPNVNDWSLAPFNSTDKILAAAPGALDAFRAAPLQLCGARGEWVSFQFVVRAGDKPIEKLRVERNGLASAGADFIPANRLQLFRENYVRVAHPSGNRVLTPRWWPDALVPLDLAAGRIGAGKSAVFWGALQVPPDAAPGDYFGELDVLADDAPRRLALALTVSSAKLPPPRFRGTVALYYDALRAWYSKSGRSFSDEQWSAQKKRYYDFLLDYGLNAYDLPVVWNSPAAESYLKNPRVRSVRTPPLDSPDFAPSLEKFKATGTLSKAFYYWIDEPQTPADFERVRETTVRLRALGLKHLVTAHPNAALKDAVDIWCPNVGDFFGIGHLDAKALQAERNKGRETWLYTMVEPKYPHPTWLLDDDSAAVLSYAGLWRAFGATGFVYSMAHGWGPQPLENLESFAGTNGDGTLLYPAELVGGVGPMPSIRLMLLRDAIEDWALGRGDASPFALAASQTRAPARGRALVGAAAGRATLISWRLSAKRDALIVNLRASNPQAGDFVAVDVAPADIEAHPEKWRFLASLQGRQVAEKWTREGHFRYQVPGFGAVIRSAPGQYTVEMRVPLSVLDGARKLRFDGLRRTSLSGGARITLAAYTPGGDPFSMPILDLTPPPTRKSIKPTR